MEIQSIVEIARDAGVAIMKVYSSANFGVTMKSEDSPLTFADQASHDLIVKRLSQIALGYPVLSEESESVPYETRKQWDKYWLIDPLDGTKEFIKRNGEFTVNIALIEHGRPVLGVVYAPALNLMYYAQKGKGAWRVDRAGTQSITVDKNAIGGLKVVISRSHLDAETDAYLKSIGPHQSITVGSSLKFCIVAEGKAHIYPRFWPCMEWDTAAAQCVVEEAGGYVLDLENKPLLYNKPNLVNPFFICKYV